MGEIHRAEADLLSAEEEHRLALRMEAGVLAEWSLAGGGGASGASGTELEILVREGVAARRRFTEANLGLVRMVSRQLAARTAATEPDLFQEACLGLLVAVQRFDCRRGLRFSTYALFWIRAHAVAATAGVPGDAELPTSRVAQLRTVRHLEADLSQTLGRQASARDVAAAIGRTERWVRQLLGHGSTRSLESVEPGALDAAVRHHDPRRSPDEGTAAGLLAELDGASREVLELRLGFGTGQPLGYAAIARRLQVPVGRVRRLEQVALEQLRSICPYDVAAG